MGIKGQIPWNKGLNQETDIRVKLNRDRMLKTKTENNLFGGKKGKHYQKCSEVKIGERNPSWKGGCVKPHRKFYGTAAWRIWRESILKRDNCTCRICGKKEIREIHHLKSIRERPDLASDVNNGITMCHTCHMRKHKDGIVIAIREYFKRRKQSIIGDRNESNLGRDGAELPAGGTDGTRPADAEEGNSARGNKQAPHDQDSARQPAVEQKGLKILTK
jgi:5-methylcytosine-specific restriction endonuclease McrA